MPAESARIILAFDFGLKRTGVALGNTMLRTARPLKTLHAKNPQQRFEAIAELIEEWRPDVLVVGQPFHPDGKPHEMTEQCVKFARKLRGRFSLPVHMVDERFSSETDDDGDAAAVILQQYLDAL